MPKKPEPIPLVINEATLKKGGTNTGYQIPHRPPDPPPQSPQPPPEKKA